MDLPKRITPCPIIEAIVEIRFESAVPPSAVFGIMYNQLKEQYKDYEELPILELPRSVLETDEKLKYQPHYKLLKNDFTIQIGPQLISVSVKNDYPGWTNFNNEIDCVIGKLNDSGIVEKTSRIGMRYIDFFENEDMFENIKLQILLNDQPFESISKYLRSELKENIFHMFLQISNNAEVMGLNRTTKRGSLIDYDIFIDDQLTDFFNTYKSHLDKAHKVLKENFFLKLLKEDFLNKLNPEY